MTSPSWPPGPAQPPTSPGAPISLGPPSPASMPPPASAPSGGGTHGARATTRWPDGLLLAVASAAVAGTLWWAVVGHSRVQFSYGAVLLGVLVGWCTATGARRTGIAVAALAGTCTLVALVVSEYFIQRTLAVREGADVPLWQGVSFAREVVEWGIDDHPATVLFWLLAAGAAAATCIKQGR